MSGHQQSLGSPSDPTTEIVQNGLASAVMDPLSEALECLAMMLAFHEKAADPAALKHALGTDQAFVSPDDLVRLARRQGLKAKARTLSVERIVDAPLPLIAMTKDKGWFIIGAARADEVLVQRPGREPQTLQIDALREVFEGTVLLSTVRIGGIGQGKFDVTWFIPALVRYRGLIGEVLIASFFLQLFGLATPLFFQVVIDKVLVHQGLNTLDVICIGLIGIIIFETLLGGLRAHLFTHTTSRVDVELGAKLYRHLVALPLAYFQQRRVGDSVARVRELDTIREFLTSSAVTLVIDLIFTLVFLLLMWFYSKLLFLIVVVSLLLYVIISVSLTPALRKRIEERFNRGAESQAFLVESVTGVETIKASAVEPQMQRRWETLLAAYVKAGFEAAKIGIWGGQAIQLVNKVAMAVILYVGAKQVISGTLTVGELVAFNMFAGRVAEPVLRLAQLWQQFQEARVGVDRLGDILNTPVEPSASASRTALPTVKGEITFDDVTFRYRPGGREVLKRINLEVKEGEIIGIVGPSGSGKSTLTKLVQRLYVPESGRVLVDGVDLAMVDPSWLRRQVGVVLQENVLFNRSVRDNIAFQDPGLSFERIVETAKLAGAHEFVLALPEGYDTEIEERGSNLSGGQRQRLAIARALAPDPRVLIFDEATSALDAESEAIIQANLSEMARGRTVLIIAHRLSAIRLANRIVAIENGVIAEEGSHSELIARDGLYAKLWRMQMHEGGMRR